MVLLIGQYSTGKTSFIEYLLGRSYPGMLIDAYFLRIPLYLGAHIGPEPTTDKWVAVMKPEGGSQGGSGDSVIPGNAAALQKNRPFAGLSRFGSSFLGKFQVLKYS